MKKINFLRKKKDSKIQKRENIEKFQMKGGETWKLPTLFIRKLGKIICAVRFGKYKIKRPWLNRQNGRKKVTRQLLQSSKPKQTPIAVHHMSSTRVVGMHGLMQQKSKSPYCVGQKVTTWTTSRDLGGKCCTLISARVLHSARAQLANKYTEKYQTWGANVVP